MRGGVTMVTEQYTCYHVAHLLPIPIVIQREGEFLGFF